MHLNLNLVNCIFFPVKWFKLHLYGIYFKEFQFLYHVVLKISRLENRIIVTYAIYMAGLFSQKQHDD